MNASRLIIGSFVDINKKVPRMDPLHIETRFLVGWAYLESA